MKKNNDEKKLSLLFIGTFFIFAFFIIFSHKANAASQTGPQLPIIIESDVNLQVYQNYINSNYGGFWDLSQPNVIGWGSLEQGRIWSQTFAIPQVPDQVQDYLTFSPISVNTYPNFDYNNNTLTLTFSNLANTNNKPWRLITFNTVTTSAESVTQVDSVQFNVTGTINKGVYGNTGNKINYISSDIYLTNNNAWVVNMPVFVTEIPSIPLPDNDTYPEESEKPNLSDYYEPDNAPSFDNSSTTSAIQSIYNILNWFFGSNGIGGIVNFLIDNTNWALQKVINNIRNVLTEVATQIKEAIEDLSDNITGFLSDIHDKLSDFYDSFVDFADLFIYPFDQEEFEEQIDNCQLITQYNELLENCEVLQQIFNETSEPDSFILYIDFENPFADSEHKIIHGEINFNWLVPLRPVYRPFLQVFVLIECFVGGFRILGNIIGGKAK